MVSSNSASNALSSEAAAVSYTVVSSALLINVSNDECKLWAFIFVLEIVKRRSDGYHGALP